MKILVTNDDGISARGLWTLVAELKNIARVVVAAPDRERSAIGTAVTLHQPLRVQRVEPIVPEVETYSVDGTPADSVILALSKLIKDRVDRVVSGINRGPNLGDDVLISGTVGAALQGYLRDLPALALSIDSVDSPHLDIAARLAALLAKKIAVIPAKNTFLNVNLPELPLAKIKGIKITHLANKTHIDTAEEERDEKGACYRLVRRKVNKDNHRRTDIWAIEQGIISITALHANLSRKPSSLPINNGFCSDLFLELQKCTEI
jgi:5'-nucleotidase